MKLLEVTFRATNHRTVYYLDVNNLDYFFHDGKITVRVHSDKNQDALIQLLSSLAAGSTLTETYDDHVEFYHVGRNGDLT